MSSIQNDPSELRKPWQSKAWIQLLAVALGVVPLYAGTIIYHLRSDQPLSIRAFMVDCAVISPLAIVIALLLLRFLCGESPRDLNLRPGKLSSDLLAGLVLFLVMLVTNVISTHFLSQWLPASPSRTGETNLFVELAGNSGQLVLFLGLSILGVASEEVIRVFLLSRLWKVWPSTTGKLLAVVISASLFGLIHLYQQPVGVAWTAIFGLITALYYLRFGRVVPLMLSHYLMNLLAVLVQSVLLR